MPAASGTTYRGAEPGYAGAGRRPARPPGARRRHRSAADRQRFRAFNKALAYAPAASSPVDRANVVAATAPIPPRPARPARNAGAAATEINTVVAKGAQGQASVVATSTRLAAAQGNDIWMRVVMLAPSASTSMSTTVLGDTDMTLMRSYFVKPQAAIAMTFSDDPQMGMICDRFTGSATAQAGDAVVRDADRLAALSAHCLRTFDVVLATARTHTAMPVEHAARHACDLGIVPDRASLVRAT